MCLTVHTCVCLCMCVCMHMFNFVLNTLRVTFYLHTTQSAPTLTQCLLVYLVEYSSLVTRCMCVLIVNCVIIIVASDIQFVAMLSIVHSVTDSYIYCIVVRCAL